MYERLKVGTFQPNFGEIYSFYQHPQPLFDIMHDEIEHFEFVQGVNFEFINSSRNNGTKYLFIFDDSRAEICTYKEFVDIAAASKHRGFRTICLKHNLFHQIKLELNVELQNAHLVEFRSTRDTHQVVTSRVHLGHLS